MSNLIFKPQPPVLTPRTKYQQRYTIARSNLLIVVAMTLINVVSSAVYSKGFPLKTKIQLYAMALFFLVQT